MASKNHIEIIGNLGADAQVTPIGEKYVIKFRVAVTEKWKDRDGQEKEDTQWFSCSYWVKNQTISQYLTKGRQVMVEGKMRSDLYDAKDGTRREFWEIRVDDLLFFGAGQKQEQTAEPMKAEPTAEQNALAQNPAVQELAQKFGATTDNQLPF